MSAWQDKLVIVYLADAGPSAAGGVAIDSPVLVDRNGRQFLSGKVPYAEGDWCSGLVAEVAWDQVAHLIVFDSLDQYQERVASAPAFWQLPGGRDKPS